MKTLREYLSDAEKNHTALGHFNISNLEGFWAVCNAAKELNLPVVIGVSEGERDFVGVKEIVSLVRTVRDTGQPVFLNGDHTYSFERVKEVVDAGFDSVIIDGAKLSFDENVAMTKKCVDYARENNPNILIEGELGYIGQSSKVLDKIPDGVDTNAGTTNLEEAKKFVEETGVDLFAPAVGNFHGMLRTAGEEPLHIDLIPVVREKAGVPLVLHGGSGISADDFKKGIAAGLAMVHVSTELRVAYRKGLEQSLKEMPNEVAPYKYLAPARAAMQAVVKEKLMLFSQQ